jgi:RNA polymerase sigma-70 factor (ECF subfamily)
MQDIDRAYRTHAPYVLATLIRLLGSFELAEEAVQAAFLTAAERWPREGVPANPRSWLVSAGRFRTIDKLRRRARFRELEPEITRLMEEDQEEPLDPDMVKDDMLRLIFTCCHPLLPPDQQAALCLREVCGLTTEAIAAAYFVRVPTMAQRIVRAKGRIKAEAIPYEVPSKIELEERLEVVLRVIYLVFSEGHASGAGEAILRTDLCEEAVRLARLLLGHIPHPDVEGLLGLMLLQHSRRSARLDAAGNLTPLDEQDRSLWNASEIEEGSRLVRAALARPPLSTYTLQAAIAAVHAATIDGRAPDWSAIIGWYDLLMIADPGPVTELNRAIAVGMRDGPAAGLSMVDTIMTRGELPDYRYAELTRADFLRRLGRKVEARAAYHSALERTPAPAERRFIERRLAELSQG